MSYTVKSYLTELFQPDLAFTNDISVRESLNKTKLKNPVHSTIKKKLALIYLKNAQFTVLKHIYSTVH